MLKSTDIKFTVLPLEKVDSQRDIDAGCIA